MAAVLKGLSRAADQSGHQILAVTLFQSNGDSRGGSTLQPPEC